MRRMRRAIPGSYSFAYISDRVFVMLTLPAKDPAELADWAHMQIYLTIFGSQEHITLPEKDGVALLIFQEGHLCVLREAHETFSDNELCEIGKLSCMAGDVLAIVTGRDADTVDMAPGDVDPAAPARNYLQEMTEALSRADQDSLC